MARKTAQNVTAGIPRVNLMPRSEIERRQQAALVRRWGWGVVAALLIVALVGAGAYALKWTADQALGAQQQRSTTLLSQLASMSKVSTALSAQTQLGAFSTEVRAEQIGWSSTIGAITAVLPAGVTLTGFDLTTGAEPVKGADPHSAPGLTGQLTMTSGTPVDITPVIRSVRGMDGVLAADGQELASAGSGSAAPSTYTYQLTVQLDQSVYIATKGTK